MTGASSRSVEDNEGELNTSPETATGGVEALLGWESSLLLMHLGRYTLAREGNDCNMSFWVERQAGVTFWTISGGQGE